MGAKAHVADAVRWYSSPSGIATLWFGVFAGPVSWAFAEVVNYALVKWTCGTQLPVVSHVITFCALVVTGFGGLTAFGALNAGIGREDSVGVGRARFMASLGMLLSVLFAVVIVATWIPQWVLDACQ